MARLFLLLVTLVCSSSIFAQNNSSDSIIQRDIDQQLWIPFKTSYESRDWQTFNDLHTDDIMRVSKWGIKIGQEYKSSNKKHFQKKDNRKRTIDFRFEHRIHSDSISYEVGYYRIKYEEPGKEPRIHYARFHVGLIKINDSWKIFKDWDTSEINGIKVTKEDFEKAELTDLFID